MAKAGVGSQDFFKGDESKFEAKLASPSAVFKGVGRVEFYDNALPTKGNSLTVYVNRDTDQIYIWDDDTQSYINASSKEYIQIVDTEPEISSMQEGVLYITKDTHRGYVNIAGNKICVFRESILFFDSKNELPSQGEEDIIYLIKGTQEALIWSNDVDSYLPIVAESKEVKFEGELSEEYELPSPVLTLTVNASDIVLKDSAGVPLPLKNIWNNGQFLDYLNGEVGNVADEDFMYNGTSVRATDVTIVANDTIEIDLTSVLNGALSLFIDDRFSLNR